MAEGICLSAMSELDSPQGADKLVSADEKASDNDNSNLTNEGDDDNNVNKLDLRAEAEKVVESRLKQTEQSSTLDHDSAQDKDICNDEPKDNNTNNKNVNNQIKNQQENIPSSSSSSATSNMKPKFKEKRPVPLKLKKTFTGRSAGNQETPLDLSRKTPGSGSNEQQSLFTSHNLLNNMNSINNNQNNHQHRQTASPPTGSLSSLLSCGPLETPRIMWHEPYEQVISKMRLFSGSSGSSAGQNAYARAFGNLHHSTSSSTFALGAGEQVTPLTPITPGTPSRLNCTPTSLSTTTSTTGFRSSRVSPTFGISSQGLTTTRDDLLLQQQQLQKKLKEIHQNDKMMSSRDTNRLFSPYEINNNQQQSRIFEQQMNPLRNGNGFPLTSPNNNQNNTNTNTNTNYNYNSNNQLPRRSCSSDNFVSLLNSPLFLQQMQAIEQIQDFSPKSGTGNTPNSATCSQFGGLLNRMILNGGGAGLTGSASSQISSHLSPHILSNLANSGSAAAAAAVAAAAACHSASATSVNQRFLWPSPSSSNQNDYQSGKTISTTPRRLTPTELVKSPTNGGGSSGATATAVTTNLLHNIHIYSPTNSNQSSQGSPKTNHHQSSSTLTTTWAGQRSPLVGSGGLLSNNNNLGGAGFSCLNGSPRNLSGGGGSGTLHTPKLSSSMFTNMPTPPSASAFDLWGHEFRFPTTPFVGGGNDLQHYISSDQLFYPTSSSKNSPKFTMQQQQISPNYKLRKGCDYMTTSKQDQQIVEKIQNQQQQDIDKTTAFGTADQSNNRQQNKGDLSPLITSFKEKAASNSGINGLCQQQQQQEQQICKPDSLPSPPLKPMELDTGHEEEEDEEEIDLVLASSREQLQTNGQPAQWVSAASADDKNPASNQANAANSKSNQVPARSASAIPMIYISSACPQQQQQLLRNNNKSRRPLQVQQIEQQHHQISAGNAGNQQLIKHHSKRAFCSNIFQPNQLDNEENSCDPQWSHERHHSSSAPPIFGDELGNYDCVQMDAVVGYAQPEVCRLNKSSMNNNGVNIASNYQQQQQPMMSNTINDPNSAYSSRCSSRQSDCATTTTSISPDPCSQDQNYIQPLTSGPTSNFRSLSAEPLLNRNVSVEPNIPTSSSCNNGNNMINGPDRSRSIANVDHHYDHQIQQQQSQQPAPNQQELYLASQSVQHLPMIHQQQQQQQYQQENLASSQVPCYGSSHLSSSLTLSYNQGNSNNNISSGPLALGAGLPPQSQTQSGYGSTGEIPFEQQLPYHARPLAQQHQNQLPSNWSGPSYAPNSTSSDHHSLSIVNENTTLPTTAMSHFNRQLQGHQQSNHHYGLVAGSKGLGAIEQQQQHQQQQSIYQHQAQSAVAPPTSVACNPMQSLASLSQNPATSADIRGGGVTQLASTANCANQQQLMELQQQQHQHHQSSQSVLNNINQQHGGLIGAANNFSTTAAVSNGSSATLGLNHLSTTNRRTTIDRWHQNRVPVTTTSQQQIPHNQQLQTSSSTNPTCWQSTTTTTPTTSAPIYSDQNHQHNELVQQTSSQQGGIGGGGGGGAGAINNNRSSVRGQFIDCNSRNSNALNSLDGLNYNHSSLPSSQCNLMQQQQQHHQLDTSPTTTITSGANQPNPGFNHRRLQNQSCPGKAKTSLHHHQQQQRNQRQQNSMFATLQTVANGTGSHQTNKQTSGGSSSSSATATTNNHQGLRYQCDSCQKSFTRSDMLTRHRRLHSGDKPFGCPHCNQSFSRSDHLQTHMRTHTGQKPYKCNICKYTACRKDMITRHMRTHNRAASLASHYKAI